MGSSRMPGAPGLPSGAWKRCSKAAIPRDAWIFAERVCGVCTTVHAIASVRAVENALGITIPDNARIMRNLLEGIQYVQDHVIHFYHLHALDWVDLVSALSADPAATSRLAQTLSDWPNSSTQYFTDVKNRLATFAESGQLGLFANAYWGHPAYRLPPEANLLAVTHYLEALDWQREVVKMHAILGGKSPHPQTYLVGGMATPLDPTGSRRHQPGPHRPTEEPGSQGAGFRDAGLHARPAPGRLILPRMGQTRRRGG